MSAPKMSLKEAQLVLMAEAAYHLAAAKCRRAMLSAWAVQEELNAEIRRDAPFALTVRDDLHRADVMVEALTVVLEALNTDAPKDPEVKP